MPQCSVRLGTTPIFVSKVLVLYQACLGGIVPCPLQVCAYPTPSKAKWLGLSLLLCLYFHQHPLILLFSKLSDGCKMTCLRLYFLSLKQLKILALQYHFCRKLAFKYSVFKFPKTTAVFESTRTHGRKILGKMRRMPPHFSTNFFM